MVFCRPFLVGAGNLPDNEIRSASNAISKAWGGDLSEASCLDDPRHVFQSLSKAKGLVRLLGDAAMQNSFGGSWIEALGAWRQPTILIVTPTSSGDLPGSAYAYTALCKSLCVPLIGIIQAGGNWKPTQRRLDGLPWCGWLKSEFSNFSESFDYGRSEKMEVDDIVVRLRRRILALNPKNIS